MAIPSTLITSCAFLLIFPALFLSREPQFRMEVGIAQGFGFNSAWSALSDYKSDVNISVFLTRKLTHGQVKSS